MQKTILITGATDGIGLATAKMLAEKGHTLLIHGRNGKKLKDVQLILRGISPDANIEIYTADLSVFSDVEALAEEIASRHDKLDVLINNAGVFNVSNPKTPEGLDLRFAVNTITPYLLTKRLLPLMDTMGRVVNLSSAAQSTVDMNAFRGKGQLSDGDAYAQSKLAITAWSRSLGLSLEGQGPLLVSVNPRSLLGSKMVKQAYGINGGDLNVGADILCRAALSDDFSDANGRYFDNDRGIFSSPHPDALDPAFGEAIIDAMEGIIN